MSAGQTRFDWGATEGAPENYPMKIIDGYLRFQDGGGASVPSGATLYGGWGKGRTTEGGGVRSLPDKLDITFFSYLEDQFYEGSFALPYEKILKIFQTEEAKPKKKNRQGEDMHVFYEIIVGVAPGGTVAVWVSANGNKEVFFGQAKKIEADFTKAMGFPAAKRAEFLKISVEGAVPPEMLASIRKHGIPFKKWSGYRTQYSWTPVFAVSHPPEKFGMEFFNGEGANYIYPLEKGVASSSRPVPSDIDFGYAVDGKGIEYLYLIHFNEKEMFDTFAKLAEKKLPMQLEILPTVPIEKTQIRLKHKDEAVVLKKFAIEKID